MNIEKAKAELQAAMTWPAGKNWGYGPAVKTLLDELERKEEQCANWFQMAEKLGADLDAAERRITELEAREVVLPKSYDIEMQPLPAPNGEWYLREDVWAALASAGVGIAADIDEERPELQGYRKPADKVTNLDVHR